VGEACSRHRHGARTELSSAEALAIAMHASPQTPTLGDPDDPNGRKPGDQVSVAPDDYGKIEVRGEIVSLSAQHIAIRRHDDRAGEIVVHFPRADSPSSHAERKPASARPRQDAMRCAAARIFAAAIPREVTRAAADFAHS